MRKLLLLSAIFACSLSYSQNKSIKIVIDPDPVKIEIGQELNLNSKAFDVDGNELQGQFIYQLLRPGGLVPTSGAQVDSLGKITGRLPGTYSMIVFWVGQPGFNKKYIEINVLNKGISKVAINNLPNELYSGSVINLDVSVVDELGYPVEDQTVSVSSDNEKIARVDNFNNLFAIGIGNANIITKVGKLQTKVAIKVIKNPTVKIELTGSANEARTGDVLTFTVKAMDKSGNEVVNAPVNYAVTGNYAEAGSGAGAMINAQGKFVAEKPGYFTVIASSGNHAAQMSLKIVDRGVKREIRLEGNAIVSDKNTSDFWVWEGVDGRDYAVTGTWGGNGVAYFWDVTNPGNITMVDSIQVDARTVNDVKVSEDGKVCILSREGASNRKNGIVILDVTNPADVKIHSTYTENLTGGVHNMFIYQNHVYALSNGQRYDIINIEDPKNPKYVSKFEIDNPARSIHDVWIEDGIAYSSNWNDGVIMVDVGNGVAGGSPSNPVEITRAKVQNNANHAAFPFKSKSTDKFYVVAGDEIFPTSAVDAMITNQFGVIIPGGYVHFLDLSDPDNPVEVARYEVPEAGSHNMWIEDDVMYIGYYNGGVRVVDLSGELMGDLYKQGREIAHYLPLSKDGYIPNAAMTWGAQPYKGHVFFSDFHSGLWAAKLSPEQPTETTIQSK